VAAAVLTQEPSCWIYCTVKSWAQGGERKRPSEARALSTSRTVADRIKPEENYKFCWVCQCSELPALWQALIRAD